MKNIRHSWTSPICQAGGVVFVYQGFESKQDCQDGWARMTEIEKKQVKLSLLLYSDGHKFSSTVFTSVQKVTCLRLQIHLCFFIVT